MDDTLGQDRPVWCGNGGGSGDERVWLCDPWACRDAILWHSRDVPTAVVKVEAVGMLADRESGDELVEPSALQVA